MENTEKYKAILILGPPGVGKGTQGKLLSKNKNYFHFSSGEMFRNVDPATDLGRRVEAEKQKPIFDSNLTMRLFYHTINSYIESGIFNPIHMTMVLDGIPRTVDQVAEVNKQFCVQRIFHIYADDKVLIERIRKRADDEGRKDDTNAEYVQRRLDSYKQDTLPLLDCYKLDIIVHVNGALPKEKIYGMILSYLRF